MITPRRTRLVRVTGLQAFRRAIVRLADHADPAAARGCAVIVPNGAAAEHLRRAVENGLSAPRPARILPDLVTRDAWLAGMRDRLPDPPPRLSPLEREVLLQASSRDAIAGGLDPPFRLRPGIIAEMVAFYDALRRQLRTVDDFERLVVEQLERAVDYDRGAERMLAQTRFLVEAFRGYERRCLDLGRLDEHALRDVLLGSAAPVSPRHVVVTVGDRINDASGLWPCDFDLLTRIHALERIDVVATRASLDAGLGPRLHQWLPGIEEVDGDLPEAPHPDPLLMAPPAGEARLFWLYRDREDELSGVARAVKRRARAGAPTALSRTAIVFKRPLPYVYLAGQVLPAAAIPYQTFDALPLAAEPYAAALDLVFEFAASGFSRAATIALLGCPLFSFSAGGEPVGAPAVAALAHALAERRYLGDPADLARFAGEWATGDADSGGSQRTRAAAPAARAAAEAAAMVAPLARDARPSDQLGAVLAFLAAHERLLAEGDPVRERHLRARGAILSALTALRDAFERYADHDRPFSEVAATVHRWIERQTFAPRTGEDGLHLVDAQAAPYGDFDEVHLVGAIQREWPEGQRRNIFFPPSLLKDLGWPQEPDATAAARAAFDDLVGLPRVLISVSSFTLEDDAIVEPSPFLEDLAQTGLTIAHDEGLLAARIFAGEAMTLDPVAGDALGETAGAWLALRQARTAASDPRYHGQSDPGVARSYKVSSLDRYRDCPFKYFAADVLRLEEEPDDEGTPGPRARGQFAHEVLQRFFAAWQAAGHGAITGADLDEARALFGSVAEALLSRLPAAEAALERARLLGSPVAPGVDETVLRAEVEGDAPVVERLLEYSLDGETDLRGRSGLRRIILRAKADRLDLLADGTLRIVDYKLGRAPKVGHAVQLPAYAAAAKARLAGYRGRAWEVSDAGYLDLTKERRFVPVAMPGQPLERALAEGEARLVESVEGIERGEFPPAPFEPFRCGFCPFASVCRKDYVGDA